MGCKHERSIFCTSTKVAKDKIAVLSLGYYDGVPIQLSGANQKRVICQTRLEPHHPCAVRAKPLNKPSFRNFTLQVF